MSIGKYMKLLKMVEGAPKLICTYCGVETPSAGDIGVCSNCESIIHMSRQSLRGRNAELVRNLEAVGGAMEKRDFDSAIAVYDTMKSDTEEPQLLYAEALAYIKYSNSEVARISYDKPGFMEENTAHRDKGAKLTSAAKLLLAKGIKLADDEIAKGNPSVNLVYTLFLLQMKLGSLKGANHTLKMLGGITSGYMFEYANMVFAAGTEKYDDIMKYAETMMKANHLSLNLFYYVAFALMKKSNFRDSDAILRELRQNMKTQNVEALLGEIGNAQRV